MNQVMQTGSTLADAAEVALSVKQSQKQKMQFGTFISCPCQQLKTFWLSKRWKQFLLYCIQTPTEILICYSDSNNPHSLKASIPQTSSCLDVEDIEEVKISENSKNELTMLIKNTNLEWKLKFETQNLSEGWKRRIERFKAKKHKNKPSKLKQIMLVNLNLAMKPYFTTGQSDISTQDGSQGSLKCKQIKSIVNQYQCDLKKMIKKLLERQQSQISEIKGVLLRDIKEELQQQKTVNQRLRQQKAGLLDDNLRLKTVSQALQQEFSAVKQTNQQLKVEAAKAKSEEAQIYAKFIAKVGESDYLLKIQQEKYNILNQKLQKQIEHAQGVEKIKQQTQGKLNQISSKYEELLTNFAVLKDQFTKLEAQNVEKTKQISELCSSFKEVQQRQKKALAQLQQKKMEMAIQNREQAESLRKTIKQKNKLQSDLKQLRQALEIKDQLASKSQEFERILLQQRNLRLFDGDILKYSQNAEKEFIKTQIEQYIKQEIEFTKRIYHVDQNNTTSFHKYIDEVENICVLIKLKNGYIAAGFSVSAVSTKQIASKGGLIMSVTNNKCFKLAEGKRSVTYDTFFLIFGNSQLRLKHGQKKFFTNFAIANGFYPCNGEKHTVFTGEGTEKEVELDTFEVFEIRFKRNN